MAGHSAFETTETAVYAESSYLNYSMYVIMDRALPHIADGLKPVQRRILYAMSELKLTHQAKYKKSARTVGDTLGKYHPHGDSACYEAMVILAQPFSTHYPLIDGQGNWGSIDDPKSFAAMRYTESKMTSYANTLLAEIKLDTVEWKYNFDGTMQEPCLLPAQLPNILLNGTTGIAVGMATDIPPHNMTEVVNACIATLTKKRISDDDILNYITIPDFPTGGEVISSLEKVHEAYRTGRGAIKVRSTLEHTKDTVVITSLPYRVTLQKIIVAIDDQARLKKLPITDITDESDEKNPVRLVLTVKGREKQDLVMAILFATTDLEKTMKINLNMIGQDGRPEVKPLATVIREWCACRQNFFERKKRFRLRAVEARLHIVDGLLIAYNHLDEIIRIVRESDEPKVQMMARFSLSDIQAQAILELRLRQLAKLEQRSLEDEHETLSKECGELKALLADDAKIKRAMISEIKAAASMHAVPRQTVHYVRTEASSAAIASTMIIQEDTTVVLSKNNWLRALKGHDVDLSKLSYKEGDDYAYHIETRTDLPVVFMGTQGRFFTVFPHQLPNGKTMGEPITTKCTFENGETVFAPLAFDKEAKVLLTTRKGNGFLVPMESLDTRAKKGKAVLNLTEHDNALHPILMGDEDELAMITKSGRLIVIPVDELNISNKSQGTRLVDIKTDEFASQEDALLQVKPISSTDDLVVFCGKRKFILSPDKRNYYRAKRARRGVFFEHGKKDLSFL
jgi:topoisomerase-4 subunit A